MLELAYIAPVVLEQILIARLYPALSLKDMSIAADMSSTGQEALIFAAGQDAVARNFGIRNPHGIKRQAIEDRHLRHRKLAAYHHPQTRPVLR